MILGGDGLEREVLAQIQQLFQAARAIGERALLLHRHLRVRENRASARRSRP